MSQMGNYVRNRAGNPQTGGPTASSAREQVASRAKVPTRGATLNRQPGQQNTSALRQSGNTVSRQVAPQQGLQRRRSGDSQGLGHDRYDTDAESLDTTTHVQSAVQVEVSQPLGKQQYAGDESDYSEPEGISEDGLEDEGHDEQQEAQQSYEQLVQQYHIGHLSRQEGQAFLEGQGHKFPDDGNSYPTTTSGPPDGFPDNWTIGQNAPSEGEGQRSSPSPVFRPATGTVIRPSAKTERNPQAQQAPGPKQNMLNQKSIFEQSSKLRKDQNATTNKAVFGGGQYQPSNVPQLNTHVSGWKYREPVPLTKAAGPRQGPSTQSNLAPQFNLNQSAAYSHQAAYHQPLVHHGKPIEPAAAVSRPQPAKPKAELIVDYEPMAQDPVVEPQPVEDYDLPGLYEKTYDELKADDFDTVPRGKPQVLSEDMEQHPLAERLTHVGKNLNAGDQDKFFRALRTSEWEEAGDWFLEQFSNIITRTKEARQKKRKLASDFENTIEKRYRHVAKRQQHVKGALDKMKTQGEGLMPRSPRPSKSPQKKK